MTIEELRSAMRRKVVPEEVVPQNVINCLIDEDAEPPKPDAFTFLMRLRALGIGSTDFVNLLEGCGAPEGVVARIKQNPAMNLQGLILTLENSELDSDDYTRMLLTARQVWERTLTLRLEKAEVLSHEIDEYEDAEDEEPADNYESEQDEAETPDENDQEKEAEEAQDEQENEEQPEQEIEEEIEKETAEEYEEEFDPEYDEDMREMSFTAVFEKISAEIRAGKITPDEPTLPTPHSPDKEDQAKAAEEPEPAGEDYGIADLSFTSAFDKIKAEKRMAFSDDLSDKTEEQPPVRKEDEEKFSEDVPEQEPDEAPEKGSDEEPAIDAIIKTARQKKQSRIIDEIRNDSDDDEPDGEYDDYDEYDDEYDDEDYDEEQDEDYDEEYEDDNEPRVYRKGAIIWAASGAAILIGAGVLIGATVGKSSSKSLRYAKNNSEVFNKIRYAYEAQTPGGENPSSVDPDYSTLFGDLLINGEGGANSLGSFSIGTELYSVTEEAISANIVENGAIRSLADVVPPEKARFVAAFDEDGKLYALFSGKQSGYVKVSGGKAEYTVRQDGVLTDYEYSDGEIRLGTVYTPVFYETFSIEDEDVYLPKTGTEELSAISVKDVIISETEGYSYGVSAGYSTANGERKDVCAVIGNPLAASANGRFALNGGENGLLLKADGKKLETRSTDKLLRAAFCENGGAILEEKKPEEGEGSSSEANKVTLLKSDLKPASILSGVPERITGMWYDGGLLTISGESNSILRVDCADPAKPNPLTLRSAVGVTAEQSALTLETNGGTLTITRYDLENGTAKKLSEYTKSLPAEQLASVKLGDPKTAVINGGTSGVAYSYFDGVSVVSEYVVFANGQQPKTETLFDDKTGFTAAFPNGDRISAVCGEGVKTLT